MTAVDTTRRSDGAPWWKPVSLDDMLATGATYRQLDYWYANGHLSPGGRRPPLDGPGIPRTWSGRDRDVVELLVRLRAIGILLPLAADIARRLVDDHHDAVTVGEGITITVERPVSP